MLRSAPVHLQLLPLVVLLLLASHACALPLQYLPEIPGYIPVYIRHGDQPLEEVHPGLAEAFRESPTYLKNIQDLDETEPANNDQTYRNDVSLDLKDESPRTVDQPISTVLHKDDPFQKSKSSEKESVVMKISKFTPPKKVADVRTDDVKEKQDNK